MVRVGYEISVKIKKIFDTHKINLLDITLRGKLLEIELEEPPFAHMQNSDIKIYRIFTSHGPVYEPHLSETDYLLARAYKDAGIVPDDTAL
jgi:phenylacetate-CoA ligase